MEVSTLSDPSLDDFDSDLTNLLEKDKEEKEYKDLLKKKHLQLQNGQMSFKKDLIREIEYNFETITEKNKDYLKPIDLNDKIKDTQPDQVFVINEEKNKGKYIFDIKLWELLINIPNYGYLERKIESFYYNKNKKKNKPSEFIFNKLEIQQTLIKTIEYLEDELSYPFLCLEISNVDESNKEEVQSKKEDKKNEIKDILHVKRKVIDNINIDDNKTNKKRKNQKEEIESKKQQTKTLQKPYLKLYFQFDNEKNFYIFFLCEFITLKFKTELQNKTNVIKLKYSRVDIKKPQEKLIELLNEDIIYFKNHGYIDSDLMKLFDELIESFL